MMLKLSFCALLAVTSLSHAQYRSCNVRQCVPVKQQVVVVEKQVVAVEKQIVPVIVSPTIVDAYANQFITPQFVGIPTLAGNLIQLPVGGVFTAPSSPTAVINVQPSNLVVVQPVAVPQPAPAPAPAPAPVAAQPSVQVILPSSDAKIPPGTKIVIDGKEYELK